MMAKFTQETAKLATGTVAYLKGGSGPAILHLHSALGPRLSPALETLAAKHAIYMPTLPGFNGAASHDGVSTMKDLAGVAAEFIEKTIGKSCDVVAESFGGWVAMWLAVSRSDLVEQLVLEAPGGMRTKGVGGLPADPAARDRKLHAITERMPKDPRLAEVLPGNFKAAGTYSGGETLDAELLRLLPSIKARTLLLFGTKDEVTPSDDVGRRLKSAIPTAHLSYIYNAAHAVEFDQPERVARLVGAFLERGEAFVVPTADVA
jgi:pimeloyl-ACP methyl ester carboxylesterase